MVNNSDSLPNIEWVCLLQSFTSNFFGLASVLWIGTISVYLLLSAFMPFKSTSSYQFIYHLVVWGLSATSSLIAFFNNKYGRSQDGTCWFAVCACNYIQPFD